MIIAGGQENMSLSNYVMPGARTGLRMGNAQIVDTMISDGLWDAFNDYHMGITAENLVREVQPSAASSRTPSLPPRSRKPWPPSKPGVSSMRSPRS